MKNSTTIIDILENNFTYNELEITFFQKIKMFLLSPIIFLLESYYMNQIWIKRVINNLLTKDAIVAFLDRNEFGFVNNKNMHILYKKDLCASNEYYDFSDVDLVKKRVEHEYTTAFASVISENIPFDIENYYEINVMITEQSILNKEGVYASSKIYVVEFFSKRYYNYINAKNNFKKMSIVSIITIAILAFLMFYF